MITKLFIETNTLVYLAKKKGNPFYSKYDIKQTLRILFAIKCKYGNILKNNNNHNNREC